MNAMLSIDTMFLDGSFKQVLSRDLFRRRASTCKQNSLRMLFLCLI